MIHLLHEWQDLAGAFIGAFSAFAVWWIAEKFKKYNERNDNLYYLQKAIIDQMNTILETRRTIDNFLHEKLDKILTEKKLTSANTYTIDQAFFPLFSTRPLNDEILKIASGSVYIDNKVSKAYNMSQDLPHMIEDLRRQFEATLYLNKEMVFGKLNSPGNQSDLYLKHISAYKNIIEEQILKTNIPIYLKVLTESLVPIEEMRDIGIIRWYLKFAAKYKFFLTRKDFKKAVNDTAKNMEHYFQQLVEERLEQIEKEYSSK